MKRSARLFAQSTCALLLSLPLSPLVSADEARTTPSLAEERADLAREEAALARDSAALEERKAVLAERKASLARREARMARRGVTTRLSSLEQQLSDFRTQETNRGLMLTLGDVSFESGEAKLTADAMKKLYSLVDVLKANPQRDVVIEGYTDSTGSQATNLDLSQQRANAVRDFLVANGVDPDRVIARGYGEARPVASNATEEGRRENRRVELVILNEGERPSERMAAERR